MLNSTVQPPLISLFSSTGSDPLGLFLSFKDHSLPEDSCIILVNDASGESYESGGNDSRAKLISPPSVESTLDEGRAYSLSQTVLHIQSPTMRTTFIQSHGDLGIKHPWIHLQVRNMGREWGFEVGVVDQSKRRGTVRLSTFQVSRRSWRVATLSSRDFRISNSAPRWGSSISMSKRRIDANDTYRVRLDYILR